MSGFGSRLRFLGLAAFALALSPGIALAQQTYESPAAAKLEVTSASEEANKHFWAGVDDADNIFFTRAAAHFEKALEADPKFGLARVFHARNVAGLLQAQRLEQINQGISELSGATTGELLTALGMREWTAGNLKEAKALFGTASKMMPGDPHLALYEAFVTGGATTPEMGIAATRKVTERFPEFAPAYNTLGYQLWNAGNRAGGLAAIKKYAELAGDHPNPHDSYAELLQWGGRYEAAMKHYHRATELDPTFDQGYLGMAEVAQMKGEGEHARKHLAAAIEHAATPAAKLNRMRAVATSYALEGNTKAAMKKFAAVAAAAEEEGVKNVAALAHQQMATIDAMAGKGRNAAAHLAKSEELVGADNNGHLGAAAVVHANIGNTEAAMESAQKLEKAASEGSAGLKSFSHITSGAVYLSANQVDKALAELEQANPNSYMTKALLASCYDKMGQKADAMALREEVLADRQYSLQNVGYMAARLEVTKK
jgi:tetratricopeptide (TPR) repeat protein